MKKDVFIIGSKGIPANYGGFESFVEKLTEYQKSEEIRYHVSCLSTNDINKENEFSYNGAHCFKISVPNIGAGKAILYDLKALKYCIEYIKKNNIQSPIIYILACRIGPFIWKYKKAIQKLGGKLYVNPDGHEWKREKWSYPIRKYWKLSEKLMVKHADLLICDSKNIEKYIKEDYSNLNPHTTFIPYGADIEKNNLLKEDKKLLEWYTEKEIKPKEYYLIVGRFVPENNYDTMIREFMKSTTNKELILITNVEQNSFYEKLKKETLFYEDKRIKFVGTVYDQKMLSEIRKNAYGYLHGHEVGGTNPSLLEALGSTSLNLLFDIGFNREVAEESALYWTKENRNLSELIDLSDKMEEHEILEKERKAKSRISNYYNWDSIINKYEDTFLS